MAGVPSATRRRSGPRWPPAPTTRNLRPAMAKVKDRPIRRGDKVVATVDLPGVPEGTTGKVKLINGFSRPGSWMRYWVFFDNGIDLGSVGSAYLVKASAWDAFRAERERRAALGPETATNGAAATADSATP